MNGTRATPDYSFLTTGSLRVRIYAGVACLIALPSAAAFALAAIFSHQAILWTAAFVSVIVCAVGMAVTEAWRAWVLWRSGMWAGLNGERLSRDQQPVRFKMYLALHLIMAATLTWAATWLAWITVARQS